MKLLFAFILSLVFISSHFSQDIVRKINTINSDNTDFSDLTFLGDVLKGVNIVALGEQTHHDAAIFDAKVRVIKYLHEELGYNVIAFESGLYDCTKANEAIKNRKTGDSTNYLNRAIFGIWNCREVHRLASYIDSTQKTDNPLILTGFDIQHAGFFAQDSLVNDFNKFIDYVASKTSKNLSIDTTQLGESLRLLAKYSNYFNKLPPADTLFLSNTIDTLLYTINSENLNDEYIRFWKQQLKSIIADYQKRYNTNIRIRDSMMAENVKWLVNNQFKDEKIIVWAANTHLANSTTSIKSNKFLSSNKLMGSYLNNSFVDKYYFVAFTSHEGRFFNSWFLNSIATKKPKKKSIETFLYQKGYDYSFICLRSQKEKNNPYFVNSKMFGNRPNKMNLYEVADGVFYIREMYPKTHTQ
jgi:erythromycin esterase